jgi:hypothetical protein
MEVSYIIDLTTMAVSARLYEPIRVGSIRLFGSSGNLRVMDGESRVAKIMDASFCLDMVIR